MTDFHHGLLVGAIVALYLAWLFGPLVHAELHRRRVLREADRRLAVVEERLRHRGRASEDLQ